MRLPAFLLLATALVATHLSVSASERDETNYTYVIVHGAAGGGWDWKTMDQLLSTDGHVVYRPTLAGLGEKVHLASSDINLTTHINDIVNLIQFERLDSIVFVGHSYGGMVITGVMDRIPERINHVVFLDAAVPENGMAAVDIWRKLLSKHNVENGQLYFSWIDENKPFPRDVPQSLNTFTEPVSFNNSKALELPVTYIAFIHPGQSLKERSIDPSWQRAEARKWTIRTLNSDHNAHRSHPKELAALLEVAPTDRNR